MKKFLAIILCFAMLSVLVACKSEEKPEIADPSESAATNESTPPTASLPSEELTSEDANEEHDHTHINYKGRVAVFTPEDLESIEGRACDFTYEQGENTLYIYNKVSADGMDFNQVQFSFGEDHVRVSATFSADKGTEEAPATAEQIKEQTENALKDFNSKLTAIYGEGSVGEQHGTSYTSWSDHTGNYIILTRINETTIQVAYYIYATN
ncbi:MAG: hypothetical protein E7467_09115 [Ruminococcaceae bacterium]|nr:hypothetical protein [Oscillospiraceae bacterium]